MGGTLTAKELIGYTRTVYQESGSLGRAALFAVTAVKRKLAHPERALKRLPVYAKKVALQVSTLNAAETDEVVAAIGIGGGIGDYAVIARFMRDLVSHTEGFKFDIYAGVPDLARWLFGGIRGYRRVYQDSLFDRTAAAYDLSLLIDHAALIDEERTNWSKLSGYPKLYTVCQNILNYRPKVAPFVASPLILADALARHAVFENASRRDFLHKIAGIDYSGDMLNIETDEAGRARFGLLSKKYITVNNGFGTDVILRAGVRPTKCYPHFGRVVADLKGFFPGLLAVQIGSSMSGAVAEVDLNLVGRTSLREAADILSHSALHLDGDGGLVHLARCFGVNSCVVFGPTPIQYVGYPDNLNIAPAFCGSCWWVTRTWMERCPRGFATARCMTDQDPDAVAEAIRVFLLSASGEASKSMRLSGKQPEGGSTRF